MLQVIFKTLDYTSDQSTTNAINRLLADLHGQKAEVTNISISKPYLRETFLATLVQDVIVEYSTSDNSLANLHAASNNEARDILTELLISITEHDGLEYNRWAIPVYNMSWNVMDKSKDLLYYANGDNLPEYVQGLKDIRDRFFPFKRNGKIQFDESDIRDMESHIMKILNKQGHDNDATEKRKQNEAT